MTTAEIDALVHQEVQRRRGAWWGALETDDLRSAGWAGALQALARRSDLTAPQLRLYIRGGIGDALRHEWRQTGRATSKRVPGQPQTIRWPVYWPTLAMLVDNPRRRPRPTYQRQTA